MSKLSTIWLLSYHSLDQVDNRVRSRVNAPTLGHIRDVVDHHFLNTLHGLIDDRLKDIRDV